MAKKQSARKTAATPKKATATKPAKKKAPAKKAAEPAEIVLEPAEEEALDLAQSASDVCSELEVAVTSAVTQAVRKIFKQHRISLTPPQAKNVALMLFGDD
jgi:transposase